LASLTGVSATDVVVQADVTVPAGGGQAGLIARYSGGNNPDTNMYLGVLGVQSNRTFLQIWRNSGGAWHVLANVEITPASPNPPVLRGLLRFTVIGSSLSLELLDPSSNKSAIAHVDNDPAPLGAGSVGMRSLTGSTYDNFY